MRGRGSLLLLLVLLSGCSDGSSDQAMDPNLVESGDTDPALLADGGETSAAPAPEVLHYEGTFRFIANDTAVAGQHLLASQESDNCVHLDDPIRVLNGTALVTWDGPTGPMEFVLAVASEAKVVTAINPVGTGAFSATIDLAGQDNSGGDIRLVWQASTSDVPVSAALMAEARLDLVMDYLPAYGFQSMEPEDGLTCILDR